MALWKIENNEKTMCKVSLLRMLFLIISNYVFFFNLKSLKLFGLFGFIVSWAQQVTTIIELNILTLCTIFIQMRESNNNNNNNDSNKEKNIYIRVPQIWP